MSSMSESHCLEFDNFKPLVNSGIFNCISCLNGSFFFFFFFFLGGDDSSFLQRGSQDLSNSVNVTYWFFFCVFCVFMFIVWRTLQALQKYGHVQKFVFMISASHGGETLLFLYSLNDFPTAHQSRAWPNVGQCRIAGRYLCHHQGSRHVSIETFTYYFCRFNWYESVNMFFWDRAPGPLSVRGDVV